MNRRHAAWRAMRRLWCTVLTVLVVCAAGTLAPTHAWADPVGGTGGTGGTGTTDGAVLDAVERAGQDDEDEGDQDEQPDIMLTLEAITPVVTAESGFHLQLAVHNTTDAPVDAGTLDVRTNAPYLFVSRTDMQQWADGTAAIATPDELLHLDVPALAAGQRVTVTGTLDAGDEHLAALRTWGPRPVAVDYATADGAYEARLTTFLTRSRQGVAHTDSPALGITIAMPLAADAWQEDPQVRDRLITTGSSATTPRDLVTLSEEQRTALKDKDQLHARYANLQTVADPAILEDIGTPHISAIMQPDRFDITDYARVDDPDAYRDAGITDQSWAASTGLSMLRSALGDDTAEQRSIAWQGNGSWTMDALDTARAQGYDTVIATSDFDLADDATATTEVYQVPTSHGDITVLAAQSTLTALASQHATSTQALGERSDAGRLSRFMAQSAFYQMEQPYEERSLLVCVGDTASARTVATLMEAVETAGWLDTQSLDELAAVEPQVDPTLMPGLIMENVGIGDGANGVDGVREALRALASSRTDVERFTRWVLDADPDTLASPVPEDGRALTAQAWSQYLLQAHDVFALAAAGPSDTVREAMDAGARAFVQSLYGALELVPARSVSVVSESASMPVTVGNALPFPVSVRVSSITDSMEIVTSRFADVTVPAHGETQSSFVIRVSTSGRTVAQEQLVDRDGHAFGPVESTEITSSLQISDKSGFVFIAVAVLLGVVGLARQYTRKKDPDE